MSDLPAPPATPIAWADRQATLAAVVAKQMFFIGASPRSGTTWLQLLLNAHPEISCQGEAHFADSFAPALRKAAGEHNKLLERKNRLILSEVGGYPLLEAAELGHLLATAILLGLDRQVAGKPDCRAVGEKTPDNVRWFANLRLLFPRAKFILLVRDPRDVLISAWHHNARLNPGWSATKDVQSFVREMLPLVERDIRLGEAFGAAWPAQFLCVSYEALSEAGEATLLRLFGFLGAAATPELAASCVAAAAFERLSGGRARGEEAAGSHFRKGLVGDWRRVLTAETNRFVVEKAGWMLARYGWAEA
jgi:hypothetical protein